VSQATWVRSSRDATPSARNDSCVPLRVAYIVHQYFPEHVGGTEVYTHGLARRAHEEGHDVIVLTGEECPSPHLDDFVPHQWMYEDVPVVAFPYNLSVAPDVARYEYDNPFIAAQVRERLSAWAPDVVHVTQPMKVTGASVRACQSSGVRTVVTLSDFWFLCPRHTLLTWDERLCAGPSLQECVRCEMDLHGIKGRRKDRKAIQDRWSYLRDTLVASDRIVALSPFLARTFAANGIDSERLEVVRHGIEPSGLRPPEPSSGPTRLVFVGSVVATKGIHIVIAAIRSLPSLDVRFTVHGPVRETDPYVRELISAAAGDERIVFAGAFSPAEVGDVLARADFLVLPSLCYDNEPLAVKQARHVGIPVIVSRVGSLIDMVEHDVDGWTVAANGEAAWREAITRAVEDHKRGRRWVSRPQPSMDDHYATIESIYHELVTA
jgi:glycosyltransferase involved in cell wall biosynthesis